MMQRRFFKLVCGIFLGLLAIFFLMPSPILHAVVWITLGATSLIIIKEMWKFINTWGAEEEWDEDP
jgi:presenilin-like A22 family membrane protease